MSIQTAKVRAWFGVAVGVAIAAASVAALAQVTGTRDTPGLTQQQFMERYEAWLRMQDEAQRSVDCGTFAVLWDVSSIDGRLFRELQLKPEEFPAGWVNAVTARRDEIRARGCRGSAMSPLGVPLCPRAYSETLDPMQGVCRCEGLSAGSIWGTDVYTTDSNICRAAVHVGAIPESGGIVRVTLEPGRDSYEGSRRNGISTMGWGKYDASFTVRHADPPYPLPTEDHSMASRPPVTPVTVRDCPARYVGNEAQLSTGPCQCRDGGRSFDSVWGSDPYTADSALCRAALHAGAINQWGGAIRVVAEPGRDSYEGSTRNGVASQSWGSYPASIRISEARIVAQLIPVVPATSPAAVETAPAGSVTPPALEPLPRVRAAEPDWNPQLYRLFSEQARSLLSVRAAGRCGGREGYWESLKNMEIDLEGAREAIRRRAPDNLGQHPVVDYFQGWTAYARTLGCRESASGAR